jgi:hypothetical protein
MTTQAKTLFFEQVDLDRMVTEREALQAALSSKILQSRPRLASLLEYICERYFEGESDSIKEYSIATEVFRRPASFDQATDSIVRVEVFRLRKRLREFYDGEGADQPLEIVIATGHYRPEFIERRYKAQKTSHGNLSDPQEGDFGDQDESTSEFPIIELSSSVEGNSLRATKSGPLPSADRRVSGSSEVDEGRHLSSMFIRLTLGVLVFLLLVFAAIFLLGKYIRTKIAPSGSTNETGVPIIAAPGPEIRIRCGYSRAIFKDDEGNLWSADRYFSGGYGIELPHQHIARTRDPEIYLTARTGVFSYKIPLAPGNYEMRLHFAETTYSPESTLGGGENSRVFDIRLNSRPLLTQFDIVSDAGANTADVRIFRDISPDRDGFLHLDFNGSLGLPMINAIEIVSGLPHMLRPIRMVARDSFFVDKSGNLWMPDSYFSGGRLAADPVVVDGTPEPGLFAGERYGNFTYAFPVVDGTYRMTLYFSEKYWGVRAAQDHATGVRVFDVFSNGVALERGIDIVREAGPARALVKTYHGLKPNAQGKLIVSFVPEVNYASVDAVDVEQERP